MRRVYVWSICQHLGQRCVLRLPVRHIYERACGQYPLRELLFRKSGEHLHCLQPRKVPRQSRRTRFVQGLPCRIPSTGEHLQHLPALCAGESPAHGGQRNLLRLPNGIHVSPKELVCLRAMHDGAFHWRKRILCLPALHCRPVRRARRPVFPVQTRPLSHGR